MRIGPDTKIAISTLYSGNDMKSRNCMSKILSNMTIGYYKFSQAYLEDQRIHLYDKLFFEVYYRNANINIFMYDHEDYDSFLNLQKFIRGKYYDKPDKSRKDILSLCFVIGAGSRNNSKVSNDEVQELVKECQSVLNRPVFTTNVNYNSDYVLIGKHISETFKTQASNPYKDLLKIVSKFINPHITDPDDERENLTDDELEAIFKHPKVFKDCLLFYLGIEKYNIIFRDTLSNTWQDICFEEEQFNYVRSTYKNKFLNHYNKLVHLTSKIEKSLPLNIKEEIEIIKYSHQIENFLVYDHLLKNKVEKEDIEKLQQKANEKIENIKFVFFRDKIACRIEGMSKLPDEILLNFYNNDSKQLLNMYKEILKASKDHLKSLKVDYKSHRSVIDIFVDFCKAFYNKIILKRIILPYHHKDIKFIHPVSSHDERYVDNKSKYSYNTQEYRDSHKDKVLQKRDSTNEIKRG